MKYLKEGIKDIWTLNHTSLQEDEGIVDVETWLDWLTTHKPNTAAKLSKQYKQLCKDYIQGHRGELTDDAATRWTSNYLQWTIDIGQTANALKGRGLEI